MKSETNVQNGNVNGCYSCLIKKQTCHFLVPYFIGTYAPCYACGSTIILKDIKITGDKCD